MKLSTFKDILKTKIAIGFELPDGQLVPGHFHVTEVGQIDKRFIDCGGTLRQEKVVSFQLWEADDYDLCLHPDKLVSIIELSEKALDIEDLEIEVEYQGATIGKYGLDYKDDNFLLTTKATDCLAKDNCGVPETKVKVALGALGDGETCTPGGGCC